MQTGCKYQITMSSDGVFRTALCATAATAAECVTGLRCVRILLHHLLGVCTYNTCISGIINLQWVCGNLVKKDGFCDMLVFLIGLPIWCSPAATWLPDRAVNFDYLF